MFFQSAFDREPNNYTIFPHLPCRGSVMLVFTYTYIYILHIYIYIHVTYRLSGTSGPKVQLPVERLGDSARGLGPGAARPGAALRRPHGGALRPSSRASFFLPSAPCWGLQFFWLVVGSEPQGYIFVCLLDDMFYRFTLAGAALSQQREVREDSERYPVLFKPGGSYRLEFWSGT